MGPEGLPEGEGEYHEDPPERREGPRTYVRAALQYGTAVVGFLAALIYIVLRTGYDSFYGTLGLSPEEVGISQTTVLVQAASTILITALLFAWMAALMVGLWLPWTGPLAAREADWRRGPEKSPRLPSDATAELILLAALFAGWGALEWFLAPLIAKLPKEVNPVVFMMQPRQTLSGPYISAIFYALFALATAGMVVWKRRSGVGSLGRWVVRVGLLTAAIGIIQLTLVGSYQYGKVEATIVQSGHPLTPRVAQTGQFDFSLFAFSADRVCAAWVGTGQQPAGLDLSVPLLYLGRAENVVALFNSSGIAGPAAGSGPIRISVDKLVLTSVDQATTTCPASH